MSSTCPTWTLKSLMPLISAFLTPVYLLDILFSFLKRGVCSRGSGFTTAVSATMSGETGTSAVSVKSLRSCATGASGSDG